MRGSALFAVALAIATSCSHSEVVSEGRDRPNVLVFVTDDQRAVETLAVMPKTRGFFSNGRRFVRAHATTPQCCPSRASILSGRYAHNHRVLTNADAASLDQDTAFHRYLNEAGYLTAVVGKYLQYPGRYDDPVTVQINPHHFDNWATFLGGYEDPLFNIDGKLVSPRGYSTEIIGRHALGLLRGFERNDARPWLLYVAPFAPHFPFEPSNGHRRDPVPDRRLNPAIRETDRLDKPPYVRSWPRGRPLRSRRLQLRTLMSVDDVIGRMGRALDRLEEENTLVIFVSDNGYLWGEHGLTMKGPPYRDSVRVPLLIRWPGHVDAGRDRRLVATIDIAPTVLEAVGVEVEGMDGISLLGGEDRQTLLLEHAGLPDLAMPAWASLLSADYQYVEYYGPGDVTVFREYYDLQSDPSQLDNLLHDGDPSNNPDIRRLRSELRRARTCSGTTCP